jgi:hypothetical protein
VTADCGHDNPAQVGVFFAVRHSWRESNRCGAVLEGAPIGVDYLPSYVAGFPDEVVATALLRPVHVIPDIFAPDTTLLVERSGVFWIRPKERVVLEEGHEVVMMKVRYDDEIRLARCLLDLHPSFQEHTVL